MSILSASLSAFVSGSLGVQAAESSPTVSANKYKLKDNIQDGVILHCFDWTYNDIKAEFDKADNGRVVLDRRTGDFHIYSDRTVVEEVEVPEFLDTKKGKYVSGTEIALADARKIKPACQLGDVITIEVKSEEFSRKAAKNAKNTIVQTIREQEKNALYNELHAKEKEIVTGVVQRINDNGDMTIDIGRTQAVLKADDNFKDKQFKCGDRIKVYVASVSNRERSGLSVKISRKSQELVKKLFEEEVTEIKDGTVEIMAIAREAGSRTKMAVRANVPHVDPVGACVGIIRLLGVSLGGGIEQIR